MATKPLRFHSTFTEVAKQFVRRPIVVTECVDDTLPEMSSFPPFSRSNAKRKLVSDLETESESTSAKKKRTTGLWFCFNTAFPYVFLFFFAAGRNRVILPELDTEILVRGNSSSSARAASRPAAGSKGL